MSTGLILEGGGMRGIFTAGVIDSFIENGIVADEVFAVSAGACHACSYVTGQLGRGFSVATDYLDDPDYCSWRSWRRTGDFFGADFLYRKIPEELYPLDHEAFRRRGIRFRVSITNCETGEAEYPLIERVDYLGMQHVRASSSMPVLANMVELPPDWGIKGGRYLDGGLSDGIPVKQSVLEGNCKNIVVLTRPYGFRSRPNGGIVGAIIKRKYKKYPKIYEAYKTMSDRYNETFEYIEEKERAGELFVIRPEDDLDIGRIEKNLEKFRKAYEQGRALMDRLMPELLEFLDK